MEHRLETKTPFNEDLLIRKFTGQENLGRLFEYIVDFVSEKQDLETTKILGKPITVELGLEDQGSTRYFHGLVTSFRQTGEAEEGFFAYRAVMKPWFWVLSRTSNCRIFQEKTVPEIIKQVFKDHGFSDYKESLSGTYQALEYCVQYRESDFNFVSRLMEQYGIYYYFTHDSNKHTLVLSDSYSAHSKVTGNSQIGYRSTQDHTYDADYIYHWTAGEHIQTGAYVMNDYDFTSPKANLEVKKVNPGKCPHSDKEFYDYPGEYIKTANGETYVKNRLEEIQCQAERFMGTGNARQLEVGSLFNLTDYYRDEQCREYLILGAQYEIQGRNYLSGRQQEEPENPYRCNFEVMNSQTPFRSERITPKPLITGPQTATVVGKSGEEIWTDEHGRVKVQFRWDREGKKDENSSCWIRVAQPWAGKTWGSISIPRIDQEVIVNFLEGDPDRPIITGSVYNGEQKPPYTLPENKTQSGVKSRSTKKGSGENFNELRFEDKKDEEQIYLHAEKDFEQIIENNHKVKIGFDKKDSGDLTLDVYNDRTTTIDQGNDTLKIKKGNQTVTLDKGDQTTKLTQGNQNTTLSSGNHSLKVSSGKSSIQAMQSIELKVGSNSIKIDQTGITIKGMMVKIEGSTMLQAKSPMSTVEGSGMLTVKGGVVMIN